MGGHDGSPAAGGGRGGASVQQSTTTGWSALARVFRNPDRHSLRTLVVAALAYTLIRALNWSVAQRLGVSDATLTLLDDIWAVVGIAVLAYVIARQAQLQGSAQRALLDEMRVVNEQYRRMAENASDVVYTAEPAPSRAVTWIAPSVGRVLGWAPEEVIGRQIADFLHPDDRAATEAVREQIYTGQPFEVPRGGFILRLATKGGDYHWMAINLHAVMDEQGRETSIIGGLKVVDELVYERQRAHAQQRLLELTADAMLDPQVLIRAVRDEQGGIADFIFVMANQAACSYLGRMREELLDKRASALTPGLPVMPLFDLLRNAFDCDTALSVDDFRHETQFAPGIAYFDIRAQSLPDDQLAVTWRDVTDRHLASERLADSERRFRMLAENSSDVILLTDTAGALNWVSPSSAGTVGWRPEEMQGHHAADFIHPDELLALREALEDSSRTGRDIRLRFRWRRHDGSYLWMEAVGRQVADDGFGRPGRVVVLRDVEAEVEAQERLRHRATYDDLTGAMMREAALDRLAGNIARVAEGGSGAAVLYLDIDHFKSVNDLHGHAVGDAVLVALVSRMRATLRELDVVARLGGDEFLIILEGVREAERAVAVAGKLLAACADPIPTPERETQLTLSIGVTMVGPTDTVDETIARADAAMYRAKQLGRNEIAAELPAP